MCGRYTLRVSGGELADRFDAPGVKFEPTYNAAPGQKLPILRCDDGRTLDRLRWGLVPSWADEDADRHINARAETVSDKPSFADAYESRRCIVPADGFYEWDDAPYYVEFERVVGLAGIWERRVPERRQSALGEFGGSDKKGRDTEETFAVLTTEPNQQVERLHHRMAAVLAPDDEDAWLEGSMGAEELGPRDEPATVRRVSERVNDPSNDDSGLVEPKGA